VDHLMMLMFFQEQVTAEAMKREGRGPLSGVEWFIGPFREFLSLFLTSSQGFLDPI